MKPVLNILIALITLPFLLKAQEKDYVGKVTIFNNIPLQKVTVTLKNKQTEAITNAQGLFFISCTENEKLSVDAHGFMPAKIKISDFKPGDTIHIDLVLKKGEKNFKYATGYDYISQEQLATVIKHYEAGPDFSSYKSVIEILERSQSGLSFTGYSIIIRNSAVLNGGPVDALLVVDGVIVNYPNFVNIPPSQIKSVDVLKGSSTSARYGSRALGGVIVITTKSN